MTFFDPPVEHCRHGRRSDERCIWCGESVNRSNPQTGAELRDLAIAEGEENADEGWKKDVHEAILKCVDRLDEFTTDDVWAILDTDDDLADPRAIGAIMQRVQRSGVIAPTDQRRPSARPEAHRRPIRVWRVTL